MTSKDNLVESDSNYILKIWDDKEKVVEVLKGWGVQRLLSLLPYVASTGSTGAKMDALRDCITSVINSKLTNQIDLTMRVLNKSATRLSIVGIALSAVIGFVGIITALQLSTCWAVSLAAVFFVGVIMLYYFFMR